jgi:ABC-2 type transport system ATP-binding protein
MNVVSSTVIIASKLSQGYGRRAVLKDIDLTIGGGIVGLWGQTVQQDNLADHFGHCRPPINGTLEVAGRKIVDERSAREARKNLGFLPQKFGYYGSFTVREFVGYFAWLRCVPSSVIKRETSEALTAVGLKTDEKTKMKYLSGGMLQRAAIAGTLVGKPSILMLDEPTVGLDPAQRLDFRAVIRSLSSACIVLSTHLLEDIRAMASRVIVLSEVISAK